MAKQDELDSKFTSIVHSVLDKVTDRIENGDEKLRSNGDIVKVAIGGKDLSVIASIFYDKRALLRGDPTSRVEKSTNKDQMKLLQDKFEDIAKQLEAKPVGETYEVIEEDK